MKKDFRRKWLIYAPLGLVLTGAGLCFTAEAAVMKYNQVPTAEWILAGTGALVVFNSGLSFFGSAVVAKVREIQTKS
ncbi:MAG: hypothetical protein ABR572_06565 [Cryomorphaceae bacterium]|nr:hypothetical protein [Flavobacteriales bacterium]